MISKKKTCEGRKGGHKNIIWRGFKYKVAATEQFNQGKNNGARKKTNYEG